MEQEYQRYGPEWVKETMQHKKDFIVELLQHKSKENQHYKNVAKDAGEAVEEAMASLMRVRKQRDKAKEGHVNTQLRLAASQGMCDISHARILALEGALKDILPYAEADVETALELATKDEERLEVAHMQEDIEGAQKLLKGGD